MFDTGSQLEVFPTDLHLWRIDPARNMRRYYRMAIHSDLFGQASLVREWGRIGSRGQMLIETHPDAVLALKSQKKPALDKQRKFYALLNCSE